MSISKLFIVLLSIAFNYAALHLPDYITACSISLPTAELRLCILKHGNAAIPHLVKGDKKYHMPALNPLEVKEIEMADANVVLKLNDIKVYGMEDVKLVDTGIDYATQRFDVTLSAAYINIVGQYSISGKLLALPIQGSGDFDAKFYDCSLNYYLDYQLEERDGAKFIKMPSETVMKINIKRSEYNLANLFGGKKDVSDQMLKLINENHEVIFDMLRPGIVSTLRRIADNIVENVACKVPYKEFYTE